MTAHLVVVGSTNVDLFARVVRHPSPGETVLGEGGGRSPGGKGANQALAAALQGAAVRFVGAVGRDADAEVALGALRAAGIDLGTVQVVEGPTGLAIITVSGDGENTIVVVAGANAAVTPQDAEAAVAGMASGDVLLLQGAAVRFVGAVGRDADAEVALGALRAAGIDLGTVQVVEGPTGLAIITVSRDGENTIVVVAGANAAVTPQDAEAAVAGMASGDVLLLQGELTRASTEAAARAAAAAGHRVVLNVAPWGALDHDVLVGADPLVLNEHEAALAVEELGLIPDDPSAASLAGALVGAGARSVVVTLGAAGAVVATGDGARTVPSRRVEAVDTTGAGDAFTGALAARLLAGDDLVTAVEHAVRVGAYAVQRRGAQPSYPTAHDTLP